MLFRNGLGAGLGFLVVLATAGPAEAHAFGQRYDLPLPLWMFIAAAAAAVGLSFIVMAVFLRHDPSANDYPRFNILKIAPIRWLARPWLVVVLRLASVFMLAIVVATGFLGAQNPLENISVIMVWVIAWVGLAFFMFAAGQCVGVD